MNIIKRLLGIRKDLTPDEERDIEETERQAYYEEMQRLAVMKGIRKARREYNGK